MWIAHGVKDFIRYWNYSNWSLFSDANVGSAEVASSICWSFRLKWWDESWCEFKTMSVWKCCNILVASRVASQVKTKDLRKSGNFSKIPEMPRFDGEYPAIHPEAKFWCFSVKNRKKSAAKHSIEKSILLNFVNLSPTFCPRLWRWQIGINMIPSRFFMSNNLSPSAKENPRKKI